jgi:TrmH family RNA methyltransferase
VKNIGFTIILSEPKYDGNIGAIARAMKNFGLKHLVLINPCKITDDGYKRAMHAIDVLESAKITKSMDEALDGIDFLIGTTGVVNLDEKRSIRNPMSPKEFAERIKEIDGNIGILFGREDYGLFNNELEKCDMLVTIPTDTQYQVMNISHAAVVIFYELFSNSDLLTKPRKTTKLEKEKMYEYFSKLLDTIDFPNFKKEKAKITFRRLMGRALPSKWEFYIMMGVFSRAMKKIKRGSK